MHAPTHTQCGRLTAALALQIDPTFLKRLATKNKNLTSVDLSRADSEDDKTVVGLVNLKVASRHSLCALAVVVLVFIVVVG
jgi:hypothetical protein